MHVHLRKQLLNLLSNVVAKLLVSLQAPMHAVSDTNLIQN